MSYLCIFHKAAVLCELNVS